MARDICFLHNPFAGAGGRLAWKGTDWPLPLRLAGEYMPRELPAWRRAFRFAVRLAEVLGERRLRPVICAPPHPMGQSILEGAGLSVRSIECVEPGKWPTTPDDMRRCASQCTDGLVVFVGGDGTARLVAESVPREVPILGVPAGVKVYSAVFASSPEAAALIVADYLSGRVALEEREILDIDEECFRNDRLCVRVWGYHKTPVRPGLVVSGKQARHTASEIEEMRDIAAYIRDEIAEDCTLLILGPGRTVYEIARALGVEKTLLGVDLVHNGRIIVRDADEQAILETLATGRYRRALVIVSPIGGQGFILGRGNQQISPAVIRRVGVGNVLVVATPTKLRGLEYLRVDTGDPGLDREFRGYRRVLVGYNKFKMIKIL